MNRGTAIEWMGEIVRCWTSMNGVYVGELLRVLPGRPWRGEVLILGVIEPAKFEESREGHKLGQRKGFRIGEKREFGGININPATAGDEATATSYLNALRKDLEKVRKAQKSAKSNDKKLLGRIAKWREKQTLELEGRQRRASKPKRVPRLKRARP